MVESGRGRRTFLVATLAVVVAFTSVGGFLLLSSLASAQVVYDNATESIRTATTDPYTWNHIPVGMPRGVVVTVAHGVESTDCIVSVSYGSAAMTRVATAADTLNEPGRAYAYFVGSSVPTGTQTVSADIAAAGACSTTDMQFVSITYTAGLDTQVLASATDAENQANPTATLSYTGRVGLAAMVFYSGLGTVPLTSACSGNSACSLVFNEDLGVFVSTVDRQTTSGTADQVMGYTSGSDDVALVYVAITEVPTLLSVSCTSGPSPLTANVSYYIQGVANYVRLTCTADGKAYTTSGGIAATPTFILPAPFTQLWSFQSSTASGTTCAGGTGAWQMTSGSQHTFPAAQTTWDYCAVIPASATADSTTFTVAWDSP